MAGYKLTNYMDTVGRGPGDTIALSDQHSLTFDSTRANAEPSFAQRVTIDQDDQELSFCWRQSSKNGARLLVQPMSGKLGGGTKVGELALGIDAVGTQDARIEFPPVIPHGLALVLTHELATDTWFETRLAFRMTNQTWRVRIFESKGAQVADTDWIPLGQPVGSVDWIKFAAVGGDVPGFFVDDISGPAPRPHAQDDQMQPLVLLTDDDLHRGYTLNWGQPEPPFATTEPAEVVLAADEFEAFELDVLAISDLGHVTLTVHSEPPLPAEAVRLRTQQGVATSGLQLEWEDYALIDGRELPMPRGSFKSFWVTLDTRQIAPGRYELQLHIQPERATARSVPLTVEVVPVRRLGDDELGRALYHTWSNIRVSYEEHLQLMRRAYARHSNCTFPTAPGCTWCPSAAIRTESW